MMLVLTISWKFSNKLIEVFSLWYRKNYLRWWFFHAHGQVCGSWIGQSDLILQYNSALLHHFGSTNQALKIAQLNIQWLYLQEEKLHSKCVATTSKASSPDTSHLVRSQKDCLLCLGSLYFLITLIVGLLQQPEAAPGTLTRASGKGRWWTRRKGPQMMLELKAWVQYIMMCKRKCHILDIWILA